MLCRLGGGAGRRGRGLDRRVADGVLGLDGVAQAGAAAVHHGPQGVPAIAAGAGFRRLPGRRAQGARLRLEHAVGQGRGRVAVAGLLLEDEDGDRRVVQGERPLHRLAGEEDQALPVGLGRGREVVARARDHGPELLALEQALHQGLVAALGQGRGARRQAGGEAVGDPEPVLGAGAVARAAGAREDRRHQEGRLGGHAAGEGEGHGEVYRGI